MKCLDPLIVLVIREVIKVKGRANERAKGYRSSHTWALEFGGDETES
jgi:hypothetical protein